MAALSLRKKLAYATIVAGLMLVFLCACLEGCLRLVGFGYDADFAVQCKSASGEKLWRENRWCTAPYFSPERVRRPQAFRLPVEKAGNAYRVFILGSSAAMGDPEASFSMARQLEVMLTEAYPKIRFEVVNAGITAVNSHLVRSYAEDCARLKPDLFIVYEGNNEVIGPFGPGTVFTSFLESGKWIRVVAWLKTTRTGQLVAQLGRRASGQEKQAWGGLQMFADRQIASDDPRLGAMRRLFQENLLAVARSAAAVDAECLLGTVITNQKDFAPFYSRHKASMTAGELADWEAAMKAGNEAFAGKDYARAEASYRQALALDGQYAETAFRLGRLLLQSERRAEAAVFLQRALDLDTLRFRMDSSLNEAVRELGQKTDASCEIVDLARLAAASAKAGVAGDDLLYEHVHLNFTGTYLVARALFERVSTKLMAQKRIEAVVAEPLAIDALRARLAYTTYEQGMIVREMMDRSNRPPFSVQSDRAQRVLVYRERDARAAALLNTPGSTAALSAVYEQAIAKRPDDWVLERNYGMFLTARGEYAQAVVHLRKSLATIEDQPDALCALGQAFLKLGDARQAEESFASVRALEPRYPGLPAVK